MAQRAKKPIDARSLAVLALGYLAGFVAYSRLPGPFLQVNQSARVLVAFTLPTTALVIYSIFGSLWKHDHIRTGNGAFEATYHAIVLRAVLFVVALHLLVMIELTGVFHITGIHLSGRIVVVLLGAMLVAIGNLLPRTRPNVAVGVRTARTLDNTSLWQQVHRAGGYATVGLGFAIIAAGLLMTRGNIAPASTAAALLAVMAVSASVPETYARVKL